MIDDDSQWLVLSISIRNKITVTGTRVTE